MKYKDKITKTELLANKANFIRDRIVDVAVKNGAGHIAPSLSCVDLLVVLYYNVLNLLDSPKDESRDYFIISKAHGAYGLYAILADIGYIDSSEWDNFYIDSPLQGCVERDLNRAIEASCGSLGHGLPMAAGIALGLKLQQKKNKVYCLIGDGELQEGSNFEALQVIAKFNLDNIVVIVDGNNLQAMDFLDNVLSYKNPEEEIVQKLKAFGLDVIICDGHNILEIREAFQTNTFRPKAIYAKTIKGYGLKLIENIPKFHFRIPNENELFKGWKNG